MSKKVDLFLKGISCCGIVVSAMALGHLAATNKYASNDQLIEAGVLTYGPVLTDVLHYLRSTLEDVNYLLWKS